METYYVLDTLDRVIAETQVRELARNYVNHGFVVEPDPYGNEQAWFDYHYNGGPNPNES